MKDEALKLALEAGFRVGPSREGPDDVWGVGANLERFATLVAFAEREACAKLCELMWHEWLDSPEENEPNKPDAEDCYRAIRARGQA